MEARVVAGERYRWVVLAVGTAAQAAVSASWFAVAILAPDIRSAYGLSLTEIGVVLAAFTIGMTPTLLPWGLLADRIGERVVLPVGLGLAAGALACVGIAPGYGALVLLLAAAGALSASVNAASGRAVMHWFAPGERGLALGIRQANVPIGGSSRRCSCPLSPLPSGWVGRSRHSVLSVSQERLPARSFSGTRRAASLPASGAPRR